MLISSSSRYSIYKVQTLSCSSQRPQYFSTSCRICQVLFYKFFKFFCAVRCAPGGCLSSHNFYILAYSTQFVKNFFQVFSNFVEPDFSCRLPQLDYFITSDSVCQELFHISANFFVCLSIFRGARRQLAYISTSTSICQALFYKFRHSFLYSLTV